jgi:hypothetical protein
MVSSQTVSIHGVSAPRPRATIIEQTNPFFMVSSQIGPRFRRRTFGAEVLIDQNEPNPAILAEFGDELLRKNATNEPNSAILADSRWRAARPQAESPCRLLAITASSIPPRITPDCNQTTTENVGDSRQRSMQPLRSYLTSAVRRDLTSSPNSLNGPPNPPDDPDFPNDPRPSPAERFGEPCRLPSRARRPSRITRR